MPIVIERALCGIVLCLVLLIVSESPCERADGTATKECVP